MKVNTTILLLVVLLGFVVPANAVLIDRGTGMIYDTELGITWLQDGATSGTIGSFEQALAWADQLVYRGYGDWRLPTSPGTAQGWFNEGEVGYLYYTELGNSPNSPASSVNSGPFIMPSYYNTWIDAPQLSSTSAWEFEFKTANSGFQNAWNVVNLAYAWAVRGGDYGPSVSTTQNYLTEFLTLGDTFSFDYWWEMGTEPTNFNFDILFFNGTEWETFGWELNSGGSSDAWETASFYVPEWARGTEAQIIFSLLDWGQQTDPTVYLRNISSNSAPVPEPATLILLGTGLLGLAGSSNRRFKR